MMLQEYLMCRFVSLDEMVDLPLYTLARNCGWLKEQLP
jgi:hypothetical protein